MEANGLDRVIMIIRNRTYPDQRVVCLDGYIHDSPKTVDTPAMVAGLLGVPLPDHADCQKLIDNAVRENGRLKGEIVEGRRRYHKAVVALNARELRQAPLEALAGAARHYLSNNSPFNAGYERICDALEALDAPAKGNVCPRCTGQGTLPVDDEPPLNCPACGGTGVKPAEKCCVLGCKDDATKRSPKDVRYCDEHWTAYIILHPTKPAEKPDWESLAIAWAKEQWHQSPSEENPAAHALYEEAIAAKAAREAAEKQESAK